MFTKSAAAAIALTASSFLLGGAEANNKYLYNDYTDLAAKQETKAYCLDNDLVQIDATDLNKRHLISADAGIAAEIDTPVADAAAAIGADASILKRHLVEAGLGAAADLDVLGLVSAEAGLGADASILKRHLIEAGLGAAAEADIAGLASAGIAAGAEASILKRGLADAAAGIGAGLETPIGGAEAGIGGAASILKRHLVEAGIGAAAAADIAGLASAGIAAGADASILKRGLVDAGLGGAAAADIAGLASAGIGAGAEGSILKRHLIEAGLGAAAEADIAGLASAGIAAGADASILKRSLAQAAAGLGGEIDAGVASAGAVAEAEGSILKRVLKNIADAKQVVLSAFTGSVPKASFTVSDVAWVKDDLFKVTINFATQDAAQLFAKFQDELKSLLLSGTEDENKVLWDGSSKSQIDNFNQWSASVLVKASKHQNLYCLPDDFAIKFDWNANDSSELHKLWADYFDTTYEYTLSQQFDSGKKKARRNYKVSKREYEEGKATQSNSTAAIDESSLKDLQSSTNVLPNFCWPAQCSS